MRFVSFIISLIFTLESFWISPFQNKKLNVEILNEDIPLSDFVSFDGGKIIIGTAESNSFNAGDDAVIYFSLTDKTLNNRKVKVTVEKSDGKNKKTGFVNLSDNITMCSVNIDSLEPSAYIFTLKTTNNIEYQYRFCIVENEIINMYPFNDETVSQMNDAVRDYQMNYEKGYSEKYYVKGRQDNIYAPDGVTFSWGYDDETDYYTLLLSEFADMKNAEEYISYTTSFNIQDLYANKMYYWQIIAHEDEDEFRSNIFSFRTADEHRTIYVDGALNTRDIGGCESKLGGRVKQGMIYRGSNIDHITEVGRIKLADKFGVHTDFDLREENNSDGKLGENSKRINISAQYYAALREEPRYASTIQVMKEFADPENYPMYIHCAIGRDRTGCAMMLLEMLLGMSKKDIYMDYELSFFASCCSEVDTPDVLLKQFDHMYDFIKNYSLGSCMKNAEKFLKDNGITDEEINSIRDILIEK